MSRKNLIIVVVAIILIIIIGSSNAKRAKNNNSGNPQNNPVQSTYTPVAERKSNGTYDIFNTDIKTDTGSTVITATVQNMTKNDLPQQKVDIVLYDKDKNELGTITTTMPSLTAGNMTTIYVESLKVYENVYDFEIK